MKYIKLYENFNLENMVNRMNHVLNLIGINMQHVVSHDIRKYAVRDVDTGDVVRIFDDEDRADQFCNQYELPVSKYRVVQLNKESSNIRYVFTCNFMAIPGNLIYNCISNELQENSGDWYRRDGINIGDKIYLVDSNEFRIDILEYYSSKDKEILDDSAIISFRSKKTDNSTITTLLKYVIEHFANCSDTLIGNRGEEITIEGIGQFVEQYLRLNRTCDKEIVINKKMAKFYLKNSNGDYNSYNFLKKRFPLVYQQLASINSEVNKSSTMSDMGFGD